jgi:hypothetical protein
MRQGEEDREHVSGKGIGRDKEEFVGRGGQRGNTSHIMQDPVSLWVLGHVC